MSGGTPLYRHSLFLDTVEQAEAAERWVSAHVANALQEPFLTNDGESRSVECRFYTTYRLQDWQQARILDRTGCPQKNAAFNCQDG